MDNFLKNSLTGQLKNSPLTQSTFLSLTPNENLGLNVDEVNFVKSPFKESENPILNNSQEQKPIQNIAPKTRKRLNDFDGKILENSIDNIKNQNHNNISFVNSIKKDTKEIIEIADAENKNPLLKLAYKIFPSIYKGWMVKKALKKLKELNIDTDELVKKQIPYGESDERYKNLITYLSSANTIQAKLGKRM